MLKNFSKQLILIVIVATAPLHLSAKSSKALVQTQLLQEVINYVEKEVNPKGLDTINITALPFDSRIRVHRCENNLDVTIANNRTFTRQFPVKLSCNHPSKPWKVFVNVRVTEMVKTLVSTTSIAKGVTIDEDMVQFSLVEKHRVKNRSTHDLSAIIGGRAMKNIPRGYQVGSLDVCLVCKGDEVSIIAKSDNLMIKTSGTAMENGAKGESIKVKNNSSNRLIKGIIGELREIYVKL